MSDLTFLDNANPAYVEHLYLQYKQDPLSVDPDWQQFFKGYEFSEQGETKTTTTLEVADKEVQVMKLINAYRGRGHLIAETNPVRPRRVHPADLLYRDGPSESGGHRV